MVRGGALALSPLLTAASQQLVKFRALLPELLAHRSLRAESGAERCRAVQSGGAAGCWLAVGGSACTLLKIKSKRLVPANNGGMMPARRPARAEPATPRHATLSLKPDKLYVQLSNFLKSVICREQPCFQRSII